MSKNIILIPVFNDFDALEILLQQLAKPGPVEDMQELTVLIINDGSSQTFPVIDKPNRQIVVMHLHRNVGHQKAIATGLAHIYHSYKSVEKVIIMDCDGEDKPDDLPVLINESIKNPGTIIVAGRKARQENLQFRIFYYLYKVMFRWLTGKRIAFGNFMLIPSKKLNQLIFYSEIMNHLPAGIIKSGIPYITIPLQRGKRYAGTSKMNFSSLLLHGLGAITVFLEKVASRLLVFSIILISFSLIVILVILYIRSFTNLAIPGWASATFSAMLIILLQGFLLSLFTIFLFLSSNSQRKFIPAKHYMDYVDSIQTIAKDA